jgi:hypothetical protein
MSCGLPVADSLLQQARRTAARRGTTLRALVEEGLRRVLGERGDAGRFRLRRVTFRGEGLHEEVAGTGWDEVRRRAYQGRGG